MSNHALEAPTSKVGLGWTELWRKEDWWAVWLGLFAALVAYALFANGSSIAWLAVAPPKWAVFSQLIAHFQADAWRYLAQFVILLGLFSVAASLIGYARAVQRSQP
jgi:hypothetical protein